MWCRCEHAECGAGVKLQSVVQVGGCRVWCRCEVAECGAGVRLQSVVHLETEYEREKRREHVEGY